MTPTREPLFLARQNYRRRRLIDAIRLVPILGALLFLIPILSSSGTGASTLRGVIYVFLVWLGLIIVAAILTTRLVSDDGEDTAGPGGDAG